MAETATYFSCRHSQSVWPERGGTRAFARRDDESGVLRVDTGFSQAFYTRDEVLAAGEGPNNHPYAVGALRIVEANQHARREDLLPGTHRVLPVPERAVAGE